MEKLMKKIIDQVDDFMIAMKSGDDARIKSEYLKLTKLRQAAKASIKPPAAPMIAKPPKIDWDNFDKCMKYERSDLEH